MGETAHAPSERHELSRQLIRIKVGKLEAGALDEDAQAANLIQQYEGMDYGAGADGWMAGPGARAAEGALKHGLRPNGAFTSIVTGLLASASPERAS